MVSQFMLWLLFAPDLFLENSTNSCVCFQLALFLSVSYFFFLYRSPSPLNFIQHLLMCLSLETLTSIIRTGLPILVELIDLVNSVISNDLTQMVNFPTRIPDCDSHSLALLDLFLSSDVICSTMWFSLHLEILFALIFHQIHNRISCFIA